MTKHITKLVSIFGLSALIISSTTLFTPSVQAQTATRDIVDTAVAAGNFTSLATALTKAELIDTLKGPGPFTVFAPTDAAFAKLPSATLNSLLNDPAQKSELTKILTYHVVAGRVPASEVVKLTSAKTVQGGDVKIEVRNGEVFLNDNVKVVTTDIQATNGIIHVIDTVLIPSAPAVANPSTNLVRSGGISSNLPTLILVAFLSLGGLVAFFSNKFSTSTSNK